MRYLILLAVLCVGCVEKNPPVGKTQSNGNATIEKVFTDENGYTMHRFKDGDSTIYYVTPGPVQVSQNWTEQQGKTAVQRQRNVTTE
jgi:hypothetical protein